MASDAASSFGLPLHDPAGGERRDRARSVSADLEAIFGETTAAPPEPRARRVARAPLAPGHRVRRLSATTLGGLAAAALAGLAAGALLVQTPHGARPPRTHPSAIPVEMVAPLQTPQAADAALAAPAPVEAASTGPAASALRHARPRATGYAQVQAADRRLRAAYAAAIRAGAPRAILVDDRDRWASLRRRGARDPAGLVAGYGALTRDLDRAAARSRGREVRTSAGRDRFLPRFRPWW
ncbi:hypothetical protein [Phenylobacterium sp.]|uniref:hypothetical protein n=1 Tax=Phenylobacterium sp. TaxID=1871053 RepID=UPI002DEFB131|nr:hypothetical protein [Phenylobacterium sp.]